LLVFLLQETKQFRTFLPLPMTRITITGFMKKDGRARLRFILWQLGRLGFLRPVAFRPRLATGLALS